MASVVSGNTISSDSESINSSSSIDDLDTVAGDSESGDFEVNPGDSRTSEWTPHPGLNDSLHEIVKRAVMNCPPEHLKEPEDGEIFEYPDEAYHRLQNWAMSKGFAVVKKGKERAGKKNAPRCRYECIHHGTKTKITRNLEEHVEKDLASGAITSNRQKERTHVLQKGCKFGASVTYRTIKQNTAQKAWILKIKDISHSHEMMPNPLAYLVHQKRQPEYIDAMRKALTHRMASLSFSQSRQVLALDAVILPNRRTYYNLQRDTFDVTAAKVSGLNGLFETLEGNGFQYRSRDSIELDLFGNQTSRILEQIVFLREAQAKLAKRFVSDFVLEVDATLIGINSF